MQGLSKALEFEVDAETNRVVVRLVDTEDHRVLRQVPSQEMLDIARALERMASTPKRQREARRGRLRDDAPGERGLGGR